MSDNVQAPTSEPVQAKPVESSAPVWYRRFIQVTGMILVTFGAPVAINLFCIVPLLLFSGSGSGTSIYGVVSLTFALLTVGAGLAAFIHGNNSLQNKPSKPLRLPSYPLLLMGGFFLLLAIGMVLDENDAGVGFVLPPILVACALLPPLWVVAWMIPQAHEPHVREQTKEASVTENVMKPR